MDDIFDSLDLGGSSLDDTGDGTGSLLLSDPTTMTPATTSTPSTSSSGGGWLSSILGVVNPLSTDAAALVTATNGTPAPTPAAAAATAATNNLIMWVVLGGLGLIAVLFLARR
jgi:hypothetical protein